MDQESAIQSLSGCPGLSISDQLRLLDLSRSGYYRWLHRKDRPCDEADKAKKEQIMRLVNALLEEYSKFPYMGYKKMAALLRAEGFEDATEKRIRLLYKQLGLRGVSPKFKTTRPPKGKTLKFKYLLRGKQIAFPNQVWATDITYIKLQGTMVYLTAIVDLYSRKILAWRLGYTMDTSFCLEVLYEAIAKYGVPAIFNTDCGSQYLSNEFIETLLSYDIMISNDSVGRCLDNAVVERTWRSVKYECIFLNEWKSFGHLQAGIGAYIKDFNSERPHQSLDYRTPDEVYEGCFSGTGDLNKEHGAA